MQRTKDIKARYWYMIQCLKSGLEPGFPYPKQSIKTITILTDIGKQLRFHSPGNTSQAGKRNLKRTLYFDMLTFTEEYDERDIELGAYKTYQKVSRRNGCRLRLYGQAIPYRSIRKKDFYIDILMYNAFMHRYLVVELKRGEFQPEYISKTQFLLLGCRRYPLPGGDNPTIGLLLVKTKTRLWRNMPYGMYINL